MTLAPVTSGTAAIRSAPSQFLDAFRRRVAAGLLTGHPHPRSHYVITEASATGLHVRATGWWTAINVGLNEFSLDLQEPGRVRYHVRFWRWALYAISLGAGLGAIGLAMLLAFDMRAYVAANPARMIPGLSIDQNVLVAWAMVLFWGFVWPWLLISFHKRFVRRLVERVIAEVDAGR